MNRGLPLLLLAAFLACAQGSADSRWSGLEFLFGKWTGTGGGEPGSGSGRFSFQPDLNGQVVVRRSFNQPAKGPRHDDLLVIYAEGPDAGRHGIYFDSEGHVIRYRIATPAANRAVFESEGNGPQYRLTYWMAGTILKGKFEIGDRTYLEWDSARDGK